MKDLLKKYWFIALSGVVLVGGIVYFAVDQFTGVMPSKQVEGKDIVFSVASTDYSADQLYDAMYEELGPAGMMQFIQRVVADSKIETTDAIIEEAKINVDTVVAQFQASYGADYESVLLQAVQQVGYESIDDLEQYFIDLLKYEEYANAIVAEEYEATKDELQPRILSHILVLMEDPANPTEEELAKVAEIEAQLDAGTSFAEVAFNHSEDSSAQSYGSLGYVDVNTQFVPEFLEAGLALEEGQVTDEWVVTDYGYHLIKNDASTYETLKEEQSFIDGFTAANPTLLLNQVWADAQDLGLTFTNPESQQELMDYLGIDGGEQ